MQRRRIARRGWSTPHENRTGSHGTTKQAKLAKSHQPVSLLQRPFEARILERDGLLQKHAFAIGVRCQRGNDLSTLLITHNYFHLPPLFPKKRRNQSAITFLFCITPSATSIRWRIYTKFLSNPCNASAQHPGSRMRTIKFSTTKGSQNSMNALEQKSLCRR